MKKCPLSLPLSLFALLVYCWKLSLSSCSFLIGSAIYRNPCLYDSSEKSSGDQVSEPRKNSRHPIFSAGPYILRAQISLPYPSEKNSPCSCSMKLTGRSSDAFLGPVYKGGKKYLLEKTYSVGGAVQFVWYGFALHEVFADVYLFICMVTNSITTAFSCMLQWRTPFFATESRFF